MSIVKFTWIIGLFTFEIYLLIYASEFDVVCAIHKKIDLLSVSKAIIFIVPRILHIIITVETIWKCNYNETILENLHEIDDIFEKKLCLQLNYKRIKQSVRNDFLQWISIIPILIIVNYFIWNVYGIVYVILLDYSHVKLILNGSQYTAYAILVRHRIQAMHEVLDTTLIQELKKQEFESIDEVIDQQNQDVNDDNEISQQQSIIHLRQIFNKIYDTIELMNDTFKWSISLNVSVDIFTISQTLFGQLQWFLDLEYENGRTINFCGFATYISYYMYRFALLVHMSNSIVESANLVAAKLHQLSLCATVTTDELKELVR